MNISTRLHSFRLYPSSCGVRRRQFPLATMRGFDFRPRVTRSFDDSPDMVTKCKSHHDNRREHGYDNSSTLHHASFLLIVTALCSSSCSIIAHVQWYP